MTNPCRVLALGATALFMALPAFAGGTFAAPEGCKVYVTAQLRHCQISQHYRCDANPAGDQWSVYMDKDGPFYVGHTDKEARWLENFELYSGKIETLDTEADPPSFSTLLMTGRDDFDFRTTDNVGVTRHYSGYDELTGEKVVIDGITLERTKFALTARTEAGEELFRRSGRQLIHRDWRLFWGDAETFENGAGDKVDSIDTPMSFARPGETGYLGTEPQYDCDMMMTELQR